MTKYDGRARRATKIHVPPALYMPDGLSVGADAANGTEPDEEDRFGHQPGDHGALTTSSPTAIVMFEETETHLREAALALRELYDSMSSVFSLRHDARWTESAMAGWQRIYGEDIVMQDIGSNYTGVRAVAESYLAKRFRITKPEALGALRKLAGMDFPRKHAYIPNGMLPMERLVIIDRRPQIETDPVFNFAYWVPKNSNVNGSGVGTAAHGVLV